MFHMVTWDYVMENWIVVGRDYVVWQIGLMFRLLTDVIVCVCVCVRVRVQ